MAPRQMPKKNQPIFPLFVPIKVRPVHHFLYNHHLMFFLSINSLPIIMCDPTIEDPTTRNENEIIRSSKKVFQIDKLLACHG